MSDQDYGDGYEGGGHQELMPGEGKRSNVLGIVGFVLAFCISPIGLLVSLIAAFKPPRGFAIAGVVVGLLGTVVWGVVGGGFWYAMSQPIVKIQSEVTEDYLSIEQEVSAQQSSAGALPASLADVTALGTDKKTDPWGNAYVYEVSSDGASWSIRVMGPDGAAGTSDDLVLEGGLGPFELAFEFPTVSDQWNDAAKAAEEAGE